MKSFRQWQSGFDRIGLCINTSSDDADQFFCNLALPIVVAGENRTEIIEDMNPKHMPSVILFACIAVLLCWFFWPKEAAGPEHASGVANEQPDHEATSVAGGVADYVDPQAFSGVDPVAVQAALAALVEAQEQDLAQQARIDRTVTNNLRQLWAGSEQYFLETGVSSVASVTLVGTHSSQYVKTFTTVAGEAYPAVILQGQEILATGVEGVRDISVGNPARKFPVAP